MIKPIIKVSLYEEIVYQIRGQIKSGAWVQGQQLPSEIELAASFGVSRNCIREALKSLGISGIVYSKPGRGTFVMADALRKIENTEFLTTISGGASFNDLMETRVILEAQIAGLAAARAIKADKEKLKKVFLDLKDELLERSRQGLTDSPSDVGLEFHMAIAEIAKNKILKHFLQSIRGELQAQRSLIRLEKSDSEQMIEDHYKLYLAIEKNDPKRAIEAMQKHLENSYLTMTHR